MTPAEQAEVEDLKERVAELERVVALLVTAEDWREQLAESHARHAERRRARRLAAGG